MSSSAKLKYLFFPVSITSARLELKARWWHRGLVVVFFVLLLPVLIGLALLGLQIAKNGDRAGYISCVEREPLLTKDGIDAVVASSWDVRITAYDSFFSSKNDADLQSALRDTSLPKQAKADLWNAKYAATHSASAGVSPEELAKYRYVAVTERCFIEFPTTMTSNEVNAEMSKKFYGAEDGWMPVDTPEGFTIAKLSDGTELYLHDTNLSAVEVKRRAEIFRASPNPQTLPPHFFEKKRVPIPKGAVVGAPIRRAPIPLPKGAVLVGEPTGNAQNLRVIWEVNSFEEVANPFRPTGDTFDIAAAQRQRDDVRGTSEWDSCRDLSPSRHRRRNILVAIISILAGSYLLQGLYRALLYIVFG
jgi:hypothetical protein